MESDHIHIVAMVQVFGVPVRVFNLDQTTTDANTMTKGTGINFHDITPTDADADTKDTKRVTLLYRPGHYDIV